MLRSRRNLSVALATVNVTGDGRQRLKRGVLVALVMWMVTGCGSDQAPLEKALAIARDDSDFDSGPEAGESLARIAQHIEDAIDRCDVEVEGTRCDALRVASGYAQVLAVQVLQCTAPGRFEARAGTLDLLVEIDDLEPDASDTPEPPPLPDCS